VSPLPFASSAWNAPAFAGTPRVRDITLVAPVHPAASVSKPWKKVEVVGPAGGPKDQACGEQAHLRPRALPGHDGHGR